MRVFVVSLFTALLLVTGCGKEQSLEQQVDQLIEEAKFEDAQKILDGKPVSPEVTELRERVHLRHGIHLIYNSEPSQMRESANQALWEFVAVLKINPNNQKAIAETEQILAIYRTFPDRQPEPAVLEELEALGFEL